jgi:hypothetical protein
MAGEKQARADSQPRGLVDSSMLGQTLPAQWPSTRIQTWTDKWAWHQERDRLQKFVDFVLSLVSQRTHVDRLPRTEVLDFHPRPGRSIETHLCFHVSPGVLELC